MNRPSNLSEEHKQLAAATGIERRYVGDLTGQMPPKIGQAFAVLRIGAVPDAVGENRLKLIEFGSPDVRVGVDDHAGHMLADTAPHDPCLAMIQREAFVIGNDRYKRFQTFSDLGKFIAAGKSQVVGISGVGGSNGRGKA